MDIKDYKILIIKSLDDVIGNIISANTKLNIAVKKGERVGDGISKYLENKFVEITQNHKYFKESLASPSGKTKNPFDIQTIFEFKSNRELIWIDLKAINIENEDTNPDSGTPDKVITLMQSGFFYLAYVIVYYKGLDEGLEFVKYDNKFVNSYFLKDVNATMRITPANQMQVNGFAPPEYRTREQFLEFLLQKKIESNERKLKKAKEKLEIFKTGILKKKSKSEEEVSLEKLKQLNKDQEDKISKL